MAKPKGRSRRPPPAPPAALKLTVQRLRRLTVHANPLATSELRSVVVRLRPRVVACAGEANMHPEYMNTLGPGTVITTAFSVMWPDAPHRVLRSCVEAAEALEGDIVGEMPMGVVQMPLPKFAVPSPTRDMTGSIAAMALYAGESVGAVTGVQSAGEVVRELADSAERLLRVWA